jgi:hypothetical protein
VRSFECWESPQLSPPASWTPCLDGLGDDPCRIDGLLAGTRYQAELSIRPDAVVRQGVQSWEA